MTGQELSRESNVIELTAEDRAEALRERLARLDAFTLELALCADDAGVSVELLRDLSYATELVRERCEGFERRAGLR